MDELEVFGNLELAGFFSFLDELRESGETNMYGAGPYIEREFDLDGDEATAVVVAWIRTFSHSESSYDRALKAKEAA